MSLERFLGTITEALADAGIPAMLTGSLAAVVRGAPRATMDVDLVIDPTSEALAQFAERVRRAGLYVSLDAAREALATRTMFNVIDPASGWKADFIVRKRRPFSESEFTRREPGELLGIPIDVARVEDLVIAKLEWAALGGSARQLEDVRALLRMAGTDVDAAYLARWIASLGLESTWSTVATAEERP
ncbi:MAG: hypothetical protein U0164_20745 [Gemmatimonadaceae bacterium]